MIETVIKSILVAGLIMSTMMIPNSPERRIIVPAHGADFSHIVATNVYLNDIREFKPMNETYVTFFSSSPPTRTTVQPIPIMAHGDPPLARISLVAVKE